jgi:hypothetical protein
MAPAARCPGSGAAGRRRGSGTFPGLRLAAALLLAVPRLSASTDTTAWTDVCTAEEFVAELDNLCPAVFLVSTLAFNPNSPGADANVTLIIQPSTALTSSSSGTQYIYLELPGFNPVGDADPNYPLKRQLTVIGRNLAVVGVDAAVGYNTNVNGVFESPALWDTETGYLELQVRQDYTIDAAVDTEIEICCLTLPTSSEKDNPAYMIWAPYGLLMTDLIAVTSVQSTAYIDPGSQWGFLQVSFDPAVSKQPTVISMTIRPDDELTDMARIIFYLPTISRASGTSGTIDFSTTGGDSDDWLIFAHEATWDESTNKLTFELRDGYTLAANKQVTLQTIAGEFVLPDEMDANWNQLTVQARSTDEVDELIRATPVMQSSRVPHVRFFTLSQIQYSEDSPTPGSFTDVTLTFQTNRPMFVGTKMYLRLTGFQAEVIEVPISGDHVANFKDGIATFSLTENILELEVISTLYSNEDVMTITFLGLIVPPALYENDESLLIWNSDYGAAQQPVQSSPEIGDGYKTFVQSQVSYSPETSSAPSNITFSLMPSIIFFQGDEVVLYLFGFTCEGTVLSLSGEDADKVEDSMGVWNADEFTLTLTVAQNKIISNDEIFDVTVGAYTAQDGSLVYPCTLPAKLTKNDGVLRVEGRGSVIDQEPIKKSPTIGSPKFILDSWIEFTAFTEDDSGLSCSGDDTNPLTKVDIYIVLNCDVLPNTTFYVQLGGLIRDHTMGVLEPIPIALSGANAPLFVDSQGTYYPGERNLAVKVIPTMWIYAGEKIKFFLERDQCFKLPYAAYANDPSFRLYIPEAGIPSTAFNYTTRVNTDTKGFDTSLVYYGDSETYIAYPNTVEEVNIKFTPNVKIFGGSIINIVLEGFILASTEVPLSSPETPLANEEDMSFLVPVASWNQQTYTLSLQLPLTYEVGDPAVTTPYTLPSTHDSNKLSVIRVVADGGFRLPRDGLVLDDTKLQISCETNQIIYKEAIKSSPLVVDRTFENSVFIYDPPRAGSPFHFTIQLRPTVDVTDAQPIRLTLRTENSCSDNPDRCFTNPIPGKVNIHISGANRTMIQDAQAQWNSTSSELTLQLATGVVMQAFTDFEIEIKENQGFVLPSQLNADDTRLTIEAIGNIQVESVRTSPMVGNGPYAEHRLCMYQFERGVRTTQSVCPNVEDCNPPMLDPCSDAELLRCGCNVMDDSPQPLIVEGFNLQQEDVLRFLPYDISCDVDPASIYVLHPFSEPTRAEVSDDNGMVYYYDVSSIKTGKFRICVDHVGVISDIGFVIVRPSCRSPLVMVDGTCIAYCPKTKTPVAGECQRDPYALEADDDQAMMLSVKMIYNVGGQPIFQRTSDDPELRYFKYMYRYEMASLLKADPNRIIVASLSNGSAHVVVNTVFTPVVDSGTSTLAQTAERSPRALISLLQQLQDDTSSSLHEHGSFFVDIDRSNTPDPIKVRLCPDETYRVFCPYRKDIRSTGNAVGHFAIGALLFPVVFSMFCFFAWGIDFDSKKPIDPRVLEKAREDPKQLDLPQQAEYARSWLEGRFMGEDWQNARAAKLFTASETKH